MYYHPHFIEVETGSSSGQWHSWATNPGHLTAGMTAVNDNVFSCPAPLAPLMDPR